MFHSVNRTRRRYKDRKRDRGIGRKISICFSLERERFPLNEDPGATVLKQRDHERYICGLLIEVFPFLSDTRVVTQRIADRVTSTTSLWMSYSLT